MSIENAKIDITYLVSAIIILSELTFNLKPTGENIMEDFDEFNPTRCAEVAAGAFVALLAIGVVKVIVQSLLNN